MNSRTEYGGDWGEMFHNAARQVAGPGSKNKPAPPDLALTEDDPGPVIAALLATGPPTGPGKRAGGRRGRGRIQRVRVGNHHRSEPKGRLRPDDDRRPHTLITRIR